MTITLSLTIDDSVASQLIQDAALATGVQGVTDEQAMGYVKEYIRKTLSNLAVQGATQRERAAADAAKQAAISAAVVVS